MITFAVFGIPAPQGSKKFVGTDRNGRGILAESSSKVKPWRLAVKHAALDTIGRDSTPLNGPLVFEVCFTLPKPTSAPKKRRTYPDRMPDLSKLVRSTEDALTDAGVWADDARVIRLLAHKAYPGEHLLALSRPGALVRVCTWGEWLDEARTPGVTFGAWQGVGERELFEA